MSDAPNRLVLTPERLIKALGAGFGFLFCMHGLALFVSHGLGYDVAKGFVPLFHVDFEHNLPTFVAFLLLIACSFASAWTSALETGRPRHRRAWAFISLLFLLLAADEAFSFHEQLGQYLYVEFGELGLPMFAWVVPYTLIVIVLGTVLLRWFLELKPSVRMSLFVSGAVFLTGAIGFELIASAHYESLDPDRATFRTLTGDLLATVEEACEFGGLSVFLHTLLKRFGGVSFRVLGAQS